MEQQEMHWVLLADKDGIAIQEFFHHELEEFGIELKVGTKFFFNPDDPETEYTIVHVFSDDVARVLNALAQVEIARGSPRASFRYRVLPEIVRATEEATRQLLSQPPKENS